MISSENLLDIGHCEEEANLIKNFNDYKQIYENGKEQKEFIIAKDWVTELSLWFYPELENAVAPYKAEQKLLLKKS